MNYRTTLLCSALAAATAVSSSAWAQTATSPSPGPTTIEEVVVTARKREESLQQIPIAVVAQTGDQLAKQSIREPTDLGRIVPSLQIVSSASSPTGAIASLRGQQAADVLLTLSQPVGFYEDNVNIPHPEGSDIAFFDLARVEVLEGPQGTLYGRNTTGGAINILTRGADFNGYHGFMYVEGGEFQDVKLAGAINIPLIDDVLSTRLAYQHWSREGFGESAITGERFGDNRDDDVARVSVKFTPTSNFSVSAKAEYDHANRTDAMYQTPELGGSLGTLGQLSPALAPFCGLLGLPLSQASNPPSCYTLDAEWALEGRPGGVLPSQQVANTSNLFTNYTELNTFEHLSVWHAAIDASWDITPSVRLRSITGYHQFTDYRTFDLDALDVQLNEVGIGSGGLSLITPGQGDTRPLRPDQESRQFTQELNLSGSVLNSHVNYLLGAFVSDDKGDSEQRAAGLPALSGTEADFYNPLITNKSWALFTQEDFKISDVFSITGGLRYTEEKVGQVKEAYNYAVGPALGVLAPLLGEPLTVGPDRYECTQGLNAGQAFTNENACALSQNLKSTGTSYLLSFNFQFTPDVLVYVKTARGFRGGALQIRADAPAVKPEIATDYEVGLKSDWFGRRLRVNLDAYQTNYANKQETQVVVIGTTSSTFIENAATARIRGVEGQITWLPIRDLTLYSTFDYLNGVYLTFPNALPAGATLPSQTVDASGAQFTNPPWQVDIGGRYTKAIGPGEVALQADYSWTAPIPQTVLDVDPGLSQQLRDRWYAAVGLINARLEYNMPDRGLTLAVFATNLGNKQYQTLGVPGLPGFYQGVTQEPRMWGLSIRKTFGDE